MCFQFTVSIPPQLFGSQPPDSLDKAAFHLSKVNGRVQGPAAIMKNVHPQHAVLTGERIDRDLGYGRKVLKKPLNAIMIIGLKNDQKVYFDSIRQQIEWLCHEWMSNYTSKR